MKSNLKKREYRKTKPGRDAEKKDYYHWLICVYSQWYNSPGPSLWNSSTSILSAGWGPSIISPNISPSGKSISQLGSPWAPRILASIAMWKCQRKRSILTLLGSCGSRQRKPRVRPSTLSGLGWNATIRKSSCRRRKKKERKKSAFYHGFMSITRMRPTSGFIEIRNASNSPWIWVDISIPFCGEWILVSPIREGGEVSVMNRAKFLAAQSLSLACG